MRYRNRTLTALFLFSIASPVHAQNEPAKDFKIAVLAEWNSILQGIHTVGWEKRIEYYSVSAEPFRPRRVDVIRQAFKRNAGRVSTGETESFDENNNVTDRDGSVGIVNQHYTAELTRSKAGGWVLGELLRDQKNLAERLQDFVPCPWLEVGNVRLYEWLSEPGFVFTRIERVGQEPNYVRGYFAFEGSSSLWRDGIKSGHIDFDLVHSYRPISFQYQVKSRLEDGIMRGTLEYEKGEGTPVLKVMSQESEIRIARKSRNAQGAIVLSADGKTVTGKTTSTFANVKYNGNVPEEEFRLSHYGLPEPMGVNWPAPSRMHIWLATAAFVAALLAAICWRAARYFREKNGS